MRNRREVYEITVLGRVTWDLHSLSNEGTVGNVTEPRTIMLAGGEQTDGVSGEMLKHVHAGYMWAIEDDKDKFCDVCKKFHPEKADGNKQVRGKPDAEKAIGEAINCELCDVHGFLVQRPAASRKSTVEFGWAVGIPEVQRSIHVHSRHALHEMRLAAEEEKEPSNWGEEKCSWERREGKKIVEKCDIDPTVSPLYKVKGKWYCQEHVPGAATPQMLYHRPTRSGVYGIISLFQPWRIGLNNANFEYTINDSSRKRRYELVLKAYQAMFLRFEGAMTSTRLPHTKNFEGVIVVSTTNTPVPVISPLKEEYKMQIKKIKEAVGEDIELIEFSDISDFVQKTKELQNREPYRVEFEKKK